MDVVNLGGHQLPNRRLDLRLRVRHARTIDERRPRRVAVAQVVEGRRQIVMIKRESLLELRHAVPRVLVQQLTQLILMRILDPQEC